MSDLHRDKYEKLLLINETNEFSTKEIFRYFISLDYLSLVCAVSFTEEQSKGISFDLQKHEIEKSEILSVHYSDNKYLKCIFELEQSLLTDCNYINLVILFVSSL